MKVISTRTHGMLDYLMGSILILSPWLFNFANGEAAMWIPIILGAAVITYSLFTDYELGAVRTISMKTHLWFDGIGGIFLALSPWLFNFNELVFLPHLIFGLLEVIAASMTDPVPTIGRRPQKTAM